MGLEALRRAGAWISEGRGSLDRGIAPGEAHSDSVNAVEWLAAATSRKAVATKTWIPPTHPTVLPAPRLKTTRDHSRARSCSPVGRRSFARHAAACSRAP